MKYYIMVAVGCASIPSVLFLLLAPMEWQKYTVCLFGILCAIIICVIMIIVGGSMKEDPHD